MSRAKRFIPPNLTPEDRAGFDDLHRRAALEFARGCGERGEDRHFADPDLQAEYLRAKEAAR